ncbi:SCO3374 family protein [Streptomyces sp. NPDC049577]|uniref:SCO3374 family protein n=1 Tax=Streptomyces sp. NPDC049577 TaxID=3155153 RepID=UPI0034234F81
MTVVLSRHRGTSEALPGARAPGPAGPSGCGRRRWYERELGWPVTDERPVRLLTGVLFDALELPAEAGVAVLGRVRAGPVALDRRSRRMWFLIAPGSADELPGLLDWLEWGGVPLDLTALGAGGRIVAPAPAVAGGAPRGARRREAVWVRPPRPGCEVEPSLPVTGLGGRGGAPDLVRLVSTAATECHRARLLRAGGARRVQPGEGQPLAFSYASRISAGTRPRSLTL